MIDGKRIAEIRAQLIAAAQRKLGRKNKRRRELELMRSRMAAIQEATNG